MDEYQTSNFNRLFLLREGFIKKKKKKVGIFRLSDLTPPPSKVGKFIYFFFIGFPNVLAHLEHIWKKMIFPLEKLKILRIFPQIWSSDPPDPPAPP